MKCRAIWVAVGNKNTKFVDVHASKRKRSMPSGVYRMKMDIFLMLNWILKRQLSDTLAGQLKENAQDFSSPMEFISHMPKMFSEADNEHLGRLIMREELTAVLKDCATRWMGWNYLSISWS